MLLDLSTETDPEDDEELAWALSKKTPLAAVAAVPRSFLPPRYMQPGQMVCLVFPHRLVKSTEWLHRLQRQLVDFARQHLVPIQTHYLALDKATSPDPAVRAAEARRFAEMAGRLPPSLVLGEEKALPLLVEWTARLKLKHTEVTTYNLALTNFLSKSPSDVFAGPRVLCNLSARSRVLVAYHNPDTLSMARAKESAEHRGARVVAVLERLFDERAQGNPQLKPRFEASALKDCLDELPSYSLLVMHSGSHAVDDEAVKEVGTLGVVRESHIIELEPLTSHDITQPPNDDDADDDEGRCWRRRARRTSPSSPLECFAPSFVGGRAPSRRRSSPGPPPSPSLAATTRTPRRGRRCCSRAGWCRRERGRCGS